MNPLRVLILGYGIRGRVYEEYARSNPSEYEVAGIADPGFGNAPVGIAAPSGVALFNGWREALDAETGAEAAIIALPDKLHCEAAKAALAKGLHILLEKPVGCTWTECLEVRAAAKKARRLVLTCYVLRFAAYYRQLREVLRSGAIGEVVSISHIVEIGYGKAAHAFCRGNWGREADGATALVQKCTHDFDLVAWWARGHRPRRVASFGSLVHWRPEARPAGAAPRCAQCPDAVREKCPFDAVRLYVEEDELRYHFPDQSDDAMRRVVEDTRYGRCVYDCGNDAVNRQSVLMEYDDGLVVTLEMEAFTKGRGRFTRFFGTRGEIVADGTTIVVRPFVGAEQVIEPRQEGAHGGGDRKIMADFVRLVRTASPERYLPLLDAALESHEAAFRAEDSRRGGDGNNPR